MRSSYVSSNLKAFSGLRSSSPSLNFQQIVELQPKTEKDLPVIGIFTIWCKQWVNCLYQYCLIVGFRKNHLWLQLQLQVFLHTLSLIFIWYLILGKIDWTLSDWMKAAGEKQFSRLSRDSQLNWNRVFDWLMLTHPGSWRFGMALCLGLALLLMGSGYTRTNFGFYRNRVNTFAMQSQFLQKLVTAWSFLPTYFHRFMIYSLFLKSIAVPGCNATKSGTV